MTDVTSIVSAAAPVPNRRRVSRRAPLERGGDLLQPSARLSAEESRVLDEARRILLKLAGSRSRPCLSSPSSVHEYLRMLLSGQERELFVLIGLDTRYRVLVSEILFAGTIDGARVYPREVVKCALRHNVAAVILAHQHPSGIAEPSAADELITQRLKQCLELVEIRVLDHCIVGDGGCYSFAESGRL